MEKLPKLYSVKEISDLSGVTVKWVQKLAPELIEAGVAQKVGSVLVCLKSAAKHIKDRQAKHKPGRPAGSKATAPAEKTVTEVFAKAGRAGKIQYFVHFSDGSEELIRTSARKYDLAHYYNEPVTGGNKTGIRRHFTFGKAPDRLYLDKLVISFAINI